MANQPLAPSPGVCHSASRYATAKEGAYVSGGGGAFRQSGNRYTIALNVEFIAGYPQKVKGWTKASTTQMTDVPRAVHQWRSSNGDALSGIGTDSHLYVFDNGTITDITPMRDIVSGTLTNPITTTNGSRTVAIADNTQALQNGDWVFLSAASAVGGLTLDNWYQVSGRSGSGYNITSPSAATSSAGPGGGTVNYSYPRTTLTNPFATTNGSATVTVTHTAHGAFAGDYVTFSGASAVGGLTLNGEFKIQTAATNSYTITASTTANATTTGGGSVSVFYDISLVNQSGGTTGLYGAGLYGAGQYGVGQSFQSYGLKGWTLDNYGYYLLSNPIGGTIYVYDPSMGGRSYPLLNAPATMYAMFVTPERFVVALGINSNPLEMAWCDQTDFTVWTSLPTNTANSGRTLIGGDFFVGGIAIRNGVSLIFSDKCVFEMTYTGGQEIYSTPQIGDNCGLVSPNAVCTEGGVVYWMSDKDFWSWNGGVQPLPTDDVRAYVFEENLNQTYLRNSVAMLNRAKRQVRFFYTGKNATENSLGEIYQYDQQCWSDLGYGKSGGTDAQLILYPLSTSSGGYLFYDETTNDADGSVLPYSLELGEMDLANGDRNADLFGYTPDFKSLNGNAYLLVDTKQYPQQATLAEGPYTLTSTSTRQDLRSNGKIFTVTLLSTDLGTSFRLGVPTLDVQPGGARR